MRPTASAAGTALSAEEFFTLVRCGGAGFYRPRSEVLRMLTAGEAWAQPGQRCWCYPYRRYRRRSGTTQLAGTSAAGGRLPAHPAGKYRRGAAHPAGGNCRSPGRPAAPQGHGMGGGRVHRNGGSAVAAVFSAGLRAAGAAPAGKPCACFCCAPAARPSALHRCGCRWRTGCSWRCCWQRAMPRWTAAPTAQSCTGALSAERNGIT
mgnify:CR=1 FL=1